MSFEGYYQKLCENGHHTNNDVYWDSEIDNTCPICDAPIVWTNLVDETNGTFCDNVGTEDPPCEGCEYCDNGRIDGYVTLEQVGEELRESDVSCQHCGKKQTYAVPIYKIPEVVTEEDE